MLVKISKNRVVQLEYIILLKSLLNIVELCGYLLG